MISDQYLQQRQLQHRPPPNDYRDPDTFDVRATLLNISEATRRNKWLVFLTCVVTLSLVTLYIYYWQPIFYAQALVVAERDSDFSRDAFYVSWNVFRKDDPRTEIELMTTGPVLKEVVERERLTYDDVYHPFLSQAAHVWQQSAVGTMYKNVKKRFVGAQDDFGGIDPRDIEIGKIVSDMRAGISIEPVGESNVGRVIVKGPSRRVAQIANTMLDVYLRKRMERYESEAQLAYDVLSLEVDRAYEEVRGKEAQRLAYTQGRALTFDLQKEGLEVTKLTDLEQSIAAGQTRIATLEANLREFDRQLKGEQATRTVGTVTELNTLRETMKLKRLELQTALILTRDRYREDSPEVTELKSNLEKIDAILATEPERVEKATTTGVNPVQQELISKRNAAVSELEGTRAGITTMQETAVGLRSRLATVPALQTKLKDLDRDSGAANEKYQALLGKRAQAAVSVSTAKATTPSLRVVEYATPPPQMWWPKPKLLYPAALIVALVLGVCASLVKVYADGRIRREHVEHGRRSMPLYGVISVATRDRPLAIAAASMKHPDDFISARESTQQT